MQAGQVVVGVEAADQLALHDRVVAALQHVLLARPEQLDRRAGHLLGDVHRLRDVVLERAAPAEAAAEVDLVDVALVRRQAGGREQRRERGLAVLRRHPHLALARACSARWRSSAPCRRGSGTGRRRPPRSSSPRRRAPPSRRRSGCRRRPARRRARPSASRRSLALETLAFGPSSHDDRQLRRARSSPATRCRRPPRPRCRRPAPPSSRPSCW